MAQSISLDGIRMNVVSTDSIGVVNSETIFTFTQEGSIVSAHYAGGKVCIGYLVGAISSEALSFRYAQIDTDGHLDGGQSTCEISRTPEGRVRLVEHFRWQSRAGSGTNVFEEIPAST